MSEIRVKYDEVYAEVTKMRNHIASDIVEYTRREYRQIRSQLQQVDGAANFVLQEAMEANCEVTIRTANVLDKLLDFMFNSAKQIEAGEQSIARAFATPRK